MNILQGIDAPKDVRALGFDELETLCEELRAELIRVCGAVGGHLGASLGAVELTVALHRVFRTPIDQLVWDVGHQAYAHKLLTGRRRNFGTLRQASGVAPFLDPAESVHDAFGAGHACTAVSVACGLLEAKHRAKKPGEVVAIVGDGALTGGLTFEGLNNAAANPAPLKIVLNDNGMSITANVGAVPRMLRDQPRNFFESLGFVYLGLCDGHDLPRLAEGLRSLKETRKPAVLHVRTHKGKGFAPAEADAHTRGHAMGPYELRDGKLVRSRGGLPTFSDAFAQALERAMVADERVLAITPAMIEGSSLTGLKARFPDRVFDVGIAEQHALAFAAGLATNGDKPVVCIYSTFLQRAFDQLIHDVALPRLPVVLAIDRAGLVGADGATHQGFCDLSMLRAAPGVQIAAPVDGADVDALLGYGLSCRAPFALRFPRGTLPAPLAADAPTPPRARWLLREQNARLTFMTLGPCAHAALEAAKSLGNVNVLDARFVEPLDEVAVLEAAATGALIVVEEASVRGGLGSAVLECLARNKLAPRVALVGLPGVRFVRHGDARAQREELGFNAPALTTLAKELLGS